MGCSQPDDSITQLKVDEQILTDPVEILNLLDWHFRKYLKPVECSSILKPADTKSVDDLLMQLSTDKAPGLDCIPANLIKITAQIIYLICH